MKDTDEDLRIWCRQMAALVADYWEALKSVVPEALAHDLVVDWHAAVIGGDTDE